jgi:parallel beta-helix repeat protein
LKGPGTIHTIDDRGFGIGLNCFGYDNNIVENEVRSNDNIGIFVDTSVNNRIAANIVSDNPYGIAILGAWGNRITGNSVSGSAVTGIRLERGSPSNLPSTGNSIAGNDMQNSVMNAWDTSGKDTQRPKNSPWNAGNTPAGFPGDLSAANSWDDGTRGNHFDDFDEAAEGFVDADSDGVGDAPHPIPGGSAIDHHPLATTPARANGDETGKLENAARSTLAYCIPSGLCNRTDACGL